MTPGRPRVIISPKFQQGRSQTLDVLLYSSSNFQDRRDGYQAALAAMKLPFDPALVVAVDARTSSEAALRALLALPDPPTAVFCYNDCAALDVLTAASSLGIAVPQALSVVGFDESPRAPMASPPLTTLSQPLYEMGRRAASALCDLIEGVPASERRFPSRSS